MKDKTSHAVAPLLPILAMAPNAWDGQWMNRQQLLSRLGAGGARVVYTTGQWQFWQRRHKTWRRSPTKGRLEAMNNVGVDRSPKWLFRFPGKPSLDWIGLRLGSRRLSRMVRRSRREPFLLKIYHPSFQEYAKSLKPAKLVYHAYDLFELTEGWNDTLEAQEDWLLANADLCIASSDFIASRLKARSGRNVHALPNGANVGAFQSAIETEYTPPEMDAIPQPRIGYVGGLNRKVDFPLIADLAIRRPNWHFVLVGPIGSLDDVTAQGLERCRVLANVHILGARNYDKLPPYVVNLDVALMPYRTCEKLWTMGIYPLKLHEYLAADRPIVSTRLPSLEPFDHVLAFAGTADEWEHEIGAALDGGGARNRKSCFGRTDARLGNYLADFGGMVNANVRNAAIGGLADYAAEFADLIR